MKKIQPHLTIVLWCSLNYESIHQLIASIRCCISLGCFGVTNCEVLLPTELSLDLTHLFFTNM